MEQQTFIVLACRSAALQGRVGCRRGMFGVPVRFAGVEQVGDVKGFGQRPHQSGGAAEVAR